jgi:hypothetical protein
MQQFEGKAQFDVHWWVDSTTYGAAWHPLVHLIHACTVLVFTQRQLGLVHMAHCVLSQYRHQPPRVMECARAAINRCHQYR